MLKEKAEKVLQKECRNEVLLEEERRFWGTKSGGYDSVRKLEKMDHKPQGFETKLERRWRWGKKGPWLSRVWLRF